MKLVYKIIFSIAIFLLNFLIIKDEISNYSRKAKIMLLLLSLLWFPAFLMELRTTIYIMMTTMLICVASSENNFFSYNVVALKSYFLSFAYLLILFFPIFKTFSVILKNNGIPLKVDLEEFFISILVYFLVLYLNEAVIENSFYEEM